MAIKSCVLAMTLTVTEESSYPFSTSNVKDREVYVNGLNLAATLTPISTVPASAMAAGTLAMTDGAATLDLTALTGINGALSLTGKKVQAIMAFNPTTNVNTITLTTGSTNGYSLGTVTLAPGDRLMIYRPDTGADVDTTHKTLDISGTGTQALSYEIVAG